MDEDEKAHLKECEDRYLKWNLSLKALSLFMLMQVRIGMSVKAGFRFVNRPAGRSWVYDTSLLYFGAYSYLLSHVAGMRAIYDSKLDSMC